MSRDQDFDWNALTADELIIPEQAAIAVYENPNGAIVIRQAGQYGVDEDHWIYVAKHHVETLARAILAIAGAQEAAPSLQIQGPKDPTATDRQRRRRDKFRDSHGQGHGSERDTTDAEPPSEEFSLIGGGS